MFLRFFTILTLFALTGLFFVPTIPTIPANAIAENTYYIQGYSCMTGEEFHSLSDDVYGTYAGQGVYNKYIVTVSGYGGYDYFRISLSIRNYQRGDKVIIKIVEIDAPEGTTVSSYYHVRTPTYKLKSGTYTVLVGYLSTANAPATYRINMG